MKLIVNSLIKLGILKKANQPRMQDQIRKVSHQSGQSTHTFCIV